LVGLKVRLLMQIGVLGRWDYDLKSCHRELLLSLFLIATWNKSDHDSQHHAAILFLELRNQASDEFVRRNQSFGDCRVLGNERRFTGL
jgi:hypothetical protein